MQELPRFQRLDVKAFGLPRRTSEFTANHCIPHPTQSAASDNLCAVWKAGVIGAQAGDCYAACVW